MYHVSVQGVDERMLNVHYYYYYALPRVSCCGLLVVQFPTLPTFFQLQFKLRRCVRAAKFLGQSMLITFTPQSKQIT